MRLLGVESPVISAETPLTLLAEGLPSGQRVHVALRGTLAAAGRDERRLDVSLVGHVLSPERLSVVIDAYRLARWGRATFEGELRVSCDETAGRRCDGVLPQARFDVEQLGERGAQSLRYRVDRLLPALGVTISDADSAAHGLLVAEVAEGSFAARAGLRAGDVILRSNGVRLHALADLAPGPGADELTLGVRRASGQRLTLHVALADAAPLADPRVLGLCLVLCPLMLFGLLRLGWFAPAALVPVVLGRLAEVRRRTGWTFGFGAVLSLALGAYSALGASAFDPFMLLMFHLAGWLVLRGFEGEGTGRFVADELGLWFGVSCVAAVSGTAVWSVLLRDQGAAPWAWNGLSRLPLTAACVLCLVSAAGLHGAVTEPQASLAKLLWERGLCAVVAALCAGLFFGGAYLPLTAGAGALALGGGVAALKSLGCYLLLAMPGQQALARSRGVLWALSFGLTVVWARLSPSRAFELGWGSALCLLAGSVLAVSLLCMRSDDGRTEVVSGPRSVRPARAKVKASRRATAAAGASARGKAGAAAASTSQGASRGAKTASRTKSTRSARARDLV